MFALDLGFSGIKALNEKGLFLCSSAICDMSGSSMTLMEKTEGIYEFEGKKYFVGDKALLKPSQSYKLDADWLLKMMPLALAHAMTEMDCPGEEMIVVGLPPEYFLKNFPILRQRMQSFVVNGRAYNHKRVSVVPQGAGSFYDFCSKTQVGKNDVSLLVDIGANTLNLMLCHGDSVVPEASMQLTREGACQAVEKLIALFRTKQRRISHAQAHAILKTSKFEGVVVEELPMILSDFAELVLEEIYNNYADHSLTRVIFSGGGANLIRGYLPKDHRFAHVSVFMNDSVFSNVRGYYLAGKKVAG